MFHFVPMLFYLGAAFVAGRAYFASDEHFDDQGYYDTTDASAYDDYDSTKDYVASKDGYDENHRFLASSSAETVCDDSKTTHLPILLLLIGYVVCQINVATMVLFIYPRMKNLPRLTIPMNVGFFIHRKGELTMLLLGESVLSLLIVDGEIGKYYKAFYFGIVTVICLQLLHFKSQPHDANAHALRRKREAAILFFNTFYIYSSALIAVGASYKLFLYSLKKYDNKRRFLQDAIGINDERWLAGGGSDYGCGPSGDERKQNIANLFSGALSIVFVTLDIMTLAHVGINKINDQCKIQGEESGSSRGAYNLKALLFVGLPRIGITVFVATLSLWQTDPAWLAVFGFAAVMGQLVFRFVGNALLHSGHGEDDGHHGHDDGHHHEGIEDEGSGARFSGMSQLPK